MSLGGVTNASGISATPGAGGTTWYTGAGAPADGTGINGDFYIDTTGPSYYGPKAGGTWGGTGPNSFGGGTTWLTGAGAPADGTGSNGNFYIDTTTNLYYGPKTAGTWSGTGPNPIGASPLKYQRFVTPGSATFTYTSATNMIYVSG